jgi:hypothetical protein
MDVGTEVIDIHQFVFSERGKKTNSLTMCAAIDLCVDVMALTLSFPPSFLWPKKKRKR